MNMTMILKAFDLHYSYFGLYSHPFKGLRNRRRKPVINGELILVGQGAIRERRVIGKRASRGGGREKEKILPEGEERRKRIMKGSTQCGLVMGLLLRDIKALRSQEKSWEYRYG